MSISRRDSENPIKVLTDCDRQENLRRTINEDGLIPQDYDLQEKL